MSMELMPVTKTTDDVCFSKIKGFMKSNIRKKVFSSNILEQHNLIAILSSLSNEIKVNFNLKMRKSNNKL